MSRVPSLNSPFLLGFDDIERCLERVAKNTGDGYPPHNIERMMRCGDKPERLRITVAVAGFVLDDLEVLVEERQLLIRGRQQDEQEHDFIHRGIATRQFQRSFLLAEGMQVLSANLTNGLLEVELVRPDTERVFKRIAILARD